MNLRLLIFGALLMLGPSAASAGDAATPFRLQWSPTLVGGVDAVKGTVENPSDMRVTDVRLRVETLGGDGVAIAETFGWVTGDVLAGGSADFLIPVSVPGTTYRVTVVSYDPVAKSPTPAASPPGPR